MPLLKRRRGVMAGGDDEMNVQVCVNLICPICKHFYVNPLNYQCGHSVCEYCMRKWDHSKMSSNVGEVTAEPWSCPVCRMGTAQHWSCRSKNMVVESLLHQMVANYDKIRQERARAQAMDRNLDRWTDVGDGKVVEVVQQRRRVLCQSIFEGARKMIVQAAEKGAPVIKFKNEKRPIEYVADMIAQRLVSELGVHAVYFRKNSWAVHLVPTLHQGHHSYHLENSVSSGNTVGSSQQQEEDDSSTSSED